MPGGGEGPGMGGITSVSHLGSSLEQVISYFLPQTPIYKMGSQTIWFLKVLLALYFLNRRKRGNGVRALGRGQRSLFLPQEEEI